MNAPSRTTLDRTYDRVPRFLRAVGTRPAIAAALATRGCTNADHAEGWDLLHRAGGLIPGAPSLAPPNPGAAALTELDAWDEPGLRLISASLARRHPAQHAFLLDGLRPAVGPTAVLVVRTLLDRLDALEAGPDRAGTRDADHAALATLARRGLDAAERQRLRALVATAQTPAPLPPPPIDDAALLTALEDLYAWYREWSTIARVTIRKRSHLIALGLARRTYTASAVDADDDGDDGVGDGTDGQEDDPADA